MRETSHPMATSEYVEELREEFLLPFEDMIEQAKAALVDGDDDEAAAMFIQQANHIASVFEALRHHEELNQQTAPSEGQEELYGDQIQDVDLRELWEDCKRTETQINELTASAMQYIQQTRAKTGEMRRALTQIAHDLEKIEDFSTTSINPQLEQVAHSLERTKDMMVNSMSNVDSVKTDQSRNQDNEESGHGGTSAGVCNYSSPLECGELEIVTGLQYPPAWLGKEGLEGLTQQWIETDDSGRQRVADLLAYNVVFSKSNVTHVQICPPPELFCVCAVECWMPGTDEIVEKVPSEHFFRQGYAGRAALHNYEYRLYTANTLRILSQWEQDVKNDKIFRREYELCWKEIVELAKGKNKTDKPVEPDLKSEPELPEQEQMRFYSIGNYCDWIHRHPGFEVDQQVFEAAQRLLNLVTDVESLEEAKVVQEAISTSGAADTAPSKVQKDLIGNTDRSSRA